MRLLSFQVKYVTILLRLVTFVKLILINSHRIEIIGAEIRRKQRRIAQNIPLVACAEKDVRTGRREGERLGRKRGERLRRGLRMAGEGDMRRKGTGIDAQPVPDAVGDQRVVERVKGRFAFDAQDQDGVVRLAEIVGGIQRERRRRESGGMFLQDMLGAAQPFGRDFAQKGERDMMVGNIGIASENERFALLGDAGSLLPDGVGQGKTIEQAHGADLLFL